ncbi:MAG: COX15/CtaA family protein [Candidatus Omnitrophica bacterium]|nr:COX15/CtaA family protein [Candidatus Omnitrophota bacterium]
MASQLTALKHFSKILCLLTLLLILLGALVKSTESGLSVPDWPTTYGKFMFAYPLDKMAGGIKYEHTHRMLASIIGLLTLILTLWLLKLKELPAWIKRLGIAAFVTVTAQGILGGLAVRYFLPVWLAVFHGVLAQTFLLILIFIAYALSQERNQSGRDNSNPRVLRFSLLLLGMIYIQLVIGNFMRHAQAGLAIPDFPTMAGGLIPTFDQAMLNRINAWRFENNMDEVTMGQVVIHFLHRFWALLIFLKLLWLNKIVYKECLNRPMILQSLFWLNMAVFIQITLGAATVLSHKESYTTTLHVTLGAIVLGVSFLMVLRAAPLTWGQFKTIFTKR